MTSQHSGQPLPASTMPTVPFPVSQPAAVHEGETPGPVLQKNPTGQVQKQKSAVITDEIEFSTVLEGWIETYTGI